MKKCQNYVGFSIALQVDSRFTPGVVNYSIANQPATVHDLILEFAAIPEPESVGMMGLLGAITAFRRRPMSATITRC